jgi:hypothetical protein
VTCIVEGACLCLKMGFAQAGVGMSAKRTFEQSEGNLGWSDPKGRGTLQNCLNINM